MRADYQTAVQMKGAAGTGVAAFGSGKRQGKSGEQAAEALRECEFCTKQQQQWTASAEGLTTEL